MEVNIGDRKIEVERADSVLKRSLGLSFRTSGKMLFVFERDTRLPIDMMLMRRPIHIYFLNSEKKVLEAEKAEPWYTLPKKFFHRPEEEYRYVLESFEDLGLEPGDQVSF